METRRVVGETVEEQTDQALRNLAAVLQPAGLTLAHVVKATVHLAAIERDFDAFDATWRRWFARPFPVRTTVGSRLDGFLVEIDVVATLPADGGRSPQDPQAS